MIRTYAVVVGILLLQNGPVGSEPSPSHEQAAPTDASAHVDKRFSVTRDKGAPVTVALAEASWETPSAAGLHAPLPPTTAAESHQVAVTGAVTVAR